MSVKSKVSLKSSYEAPQEVLIEQPTLVVDDDVSVVNTRTKPLNTIEAILPKLNKHFKEDALKIIETAILQYPDKVDKIILYANFVDESQLSKIFSVPTF